MKNISFLYWQWHHHQWHLHRHESHNSEVDSRIQQLLMLMAVLHQTILLSFVMKTFTILCFQRVPGWFGAGQHQGHPVACECRDTEDDPEADRSAARRIAHAHKHTLRWRALAGSDRIGWCHHPLLHHRDDRHPLHLVKVRLLQFLIDTSPWWPHILCWVEGFCTCCFETFTC